MNIKCPVCGDSLIYHRGEVMSDLSDFKRKAEEKKFSFYTTASELQEEINFLCDTNDEDDRNTAEIIFLSELKSYITGEES